MANQVRKPNIRYYSHETWMRVFGPSKSEGFRAYLSRTMGSEGWSLRLGLWQVRGRQETTRRVLRKHIPHG